MKRNLWILILIAFAISLFTANVEVSSESLSEVAVAPKLNTAAPAGTFVINVTISGATLENTRGYGVQQWEFHMSFNSTILKAISVKEGEFLKKVGTTIWGTPYHSIKIDNTAGTIVTWNSLFPYKIPGALGSGTLANITFNVLTKGKSDLHFFSGPTFNGTELRAYNGSTMLWIDHTRADGYFQYPLGDVNDDGKVNTSDLLNFSNAYGSNSSKPNWNPNCDLNKDDKVDVSDLFYLGKNFGKS